MNRPKKNVEEIENFYITDEYIKKNPSLHEEHSPWKFGKIIPLINRFCGEINKDEINLLDVGGGAGLIINFTSDYIEKNYNIKVNKFLLDLSPGMLEVQKKVNPDFKKVLNEDIRRTSFYDKGLDLTLMIDVLEHVPQPIVALEELKRISKYTIFKVPLEDNLYLKATNFIKRGKTRQYLINSQGHINVYNIIKLKSQIKMNLGLIIEFYFTNVFKYNIKSANQLKINKLIDIMAGYIFRLSPTVCSYIFNDFVIILVKNNSI